ncbi:MAG: serpin family protein [Bacteroidaceae bacterium]|nr:serpin family protein [Bacteroidaceae bacterium]
MKMNAMILTMAASLCLWACGSEGEDVINPEPVEPQKVEPTPVNPDPKPQETELDPVTRHSYKPVELNETQQAINQKLHEFSWKLFKEVYTNRDSGVNLMISPISLEVDLGMFINGLEGKTLQEMLKTFGLEGYSKEQVNDFFKTMVTGIEAADEAAIFKSANAFWYNHHYTAKTGYLTTIQNYYSARTEAMDFADSKTKEIINAWCAENTNNRIPHMVDRTSEADVFHLMNAVYFKSSWETPFSKEQTTKQPFIYADGQAADVDMMHVSHQAYFLETDKFQCCMKPFIDGAFQMLFVLPKKGVSVEDALNSDLFMTYNAFASQSRRVNLDLFAPKFTAEYTEENLFSCMGQINPSLVFDPNEMRFFEEQELSSGLKALQKTFFLMDEVGAEAAAVTDIIIRNTSVPVQLENKTIRLDRPFVYAIMESNTFCPLFIGYYGK